MTYAARSIMALVVVLAALLGGCFAGSSTVAGADARVEVTDGWQYRWGDSPRDETGRLVWLDDPLDSPDWKAMPFPSKPPGKGSRVWMRVQLPAGTWADPAVLLDPVMSEFEAYLDGRLVHSHGDVDSEKKSWYGVPWTLVGLDPEAPRQVLTLRIRSTFWMIGVHGRVFAGAKTSHVQSIVQNDTPRFFAGLIAILIGILGLGFAAVGTERALSGPLGLYAVNAGVYAIFYTKLKDLFFDHTMFWGDAHRFASNLAMIGLTMFVQRAFGSGPKGLILRLWQAHLVIFLAAQAGIYSFGYRGFDLGLAAPVLVGEALLRLLIAVEVVAILLVVIARAARHDRNALIFLAGVLPGMAYTAKDLLAVAGVIHFDWNSRTYLGALAIGFALSIIVARVGIERLRRYSVQLDRRAREKAVILKDLHDGIGGITTNISLLADVATRTRSAEKAQRAVSDISELSREGLAEIRSFLDTLDDKDLSWERVVNQLRHVGQLTLEPHDLEFRLTSDLEPSVPPPTSLLYLNVARIFRESLTNSLKHSGAGRVVANIRVRQDCFELTTKDDGRGFDASEVTDGHGLANMKSRAVDLGGELSMESSEGASVRLVVPLPLPHPQVGVSASPVAG